MGAMLSHIDCKVHHFHLLSEITDHNSYGNEISIIDGFIKSINGNNFPKKTTAGGELQLYWNYGSTSWVPLKDIKASNPLELEEHAINNKIEGEPAFRWRVRDVVKKLYLVIWKVSKKYWKTSHKFAIRIIKTVYEALQI